MTGAIALAVVLVIAVGGISMALQSQRNLQPPGSRTPRIPRPSRPTTAGPRRPRERTREKLREKPREATSQPAAADAPPTPPAPGTPEGRGPELLRTGTPAEAKVMSVVDERTTGPVTRSRLTLEINPEDSPTFEVTVRVAFPTPEARARVRVGATVPVRYDKDDRTRVVVDLPQA